MQHPSRDTLRQALGALAAGRPVIVTDDRRHPSSAQLVMAAESVCAPDAAFFVRWTAGVIQAPIEASRATRLALPPMPPGRCPAGRVPFTVSVDAALGVSTGISAHDRARTLRLVADPSTIPTDFNRPGHVFPIICAPGGVLERPAIAEASVDLLRAARCEPVAAAAELVDDAGAPLDAAGLRRFSERHGISVVTVGDVISQRRWREPMLDRIAETSVTLQGQCWTRIDFVGPAQVRHSAFVLGDIEASHPLVAVHVECVAGDVLEAGTCDCRANLRLAMSSIGRRGCGILLYLRSSLAATPEDLCLLAAHALRDLGASQAALVTGEVVALDGDPPISLPVLPSRCSPLTAAHRPALLVAGVGS